MTLQERAMEELVAEWSAAMLCSDIKGIKLGDDHVQQHAAYLASWMQALKDDKGAIFRAATAAQKTCDYIERLVAPRAAPVVSVPTVPEVYAANEPAIKEPAAVSVARRKAGPQ